MKPTDFTDYIEQLSKSDQQQTQTEDKATHPYALALDYLRERDYLTDGSIKLRFWQASFFRYTGMCYRPISELDLKSDIVRWLQNRPEVRFKINTGFVSNMVLNIQGKVQIPHETALNSNLNGKTEEYLIPLQNGILNPQHFLNDRKNISLLPHSEKFFSLNCLPFSFDPMATCPQWHNYLEKVQPDLDVRQLLQEWMGYNLVADVSQQKLMILLGEGANGKGVYFTVLTELLGRDNVSSVGLEGFNPNRTFPLAATIGKLANICAEIGEVNKPSEGLLKQFVAGDSITIEQKHQPAFTTRPTARLTFSTNVLPRFTDRSSGIWRRLMLIEFNIQIQEGEQDKRLTDPGFWIASGELAGVFNWALDGLARLLERKHFLIPASCQISAEAFRAECNPAKTFLQENYFVEKGKILPTSELYEEYVIYSRNNGNHPLNMAGFTREVSRVFKSIEKSKYAIALPKGGRGHAWYDLARLY